MKKLSEIKDYDYLIVVPKDYGHSKLMTKKKFLQSKYYAGEIEAVVTMAEEVYANFNILDALQALGEEDGMYEDWHGHVVDSIPQDIKNRIESEINSYVEKVPAYSPGELVDWKENYD